TPSLALSGRLPYGLHFTDAANSTGYIYGTPGRTIDASFPLEVTATNGVGTAARQSLEIHVALAPTAAFTTRASTQMTTRRYAKFEVSTLASPAARLTLSGRLPLGVRFFAKSGGHAYLNTFNLRLHSCKMTAWHDQGSECCETKAGWRTGSR
ncbi:putative Ig, partial [mine drainage metagenome]